MTTLNHLGTIEASTSEGGWRATGEVINNAGTLEWYKPIDIWFDSYLSGWANLSKLGFSGHLIPEPYEKNFLNSIAPWQAFTAQGFMKNGRVQGIFYLNVASSPANNHQIVDMTYADIVEELLGVNSQYGHCNLIKGVHPEGFLGLDIDKTNSGNIEQYEVNEGNFWQTIQQIAEIDNHVFWVDKYNTAHYQIRPMFNATLPTSVFTIDSELLLEPLQITPRNTEQVGQYQLYGTTPGGTQISGIFPLVPNYGPIITETGYKFTSGSTLADIAERKYQYENRDYTVVASLPGATGLYLELFDRLSITYISSSDGINWSDKKFWVDSIVVNLFENFYAETVLGLEAENVIEVGS